MTDNQQSPKQEATPTPSTSSGQGGLAAFWQELRQRKVVRAGITYLIVGLAIMEGGDIVLGNLGAPQWVVTALILLVIAGFPIVLVLEWIYELTPQGIRNTDDVREAEAKASGKKLTAPSQPALLLFMGAAVPTLIFGAVALYFFLSAKSARDELNFVTQTQSEEATEKSIAVLPLENMSPDPDNAYFAGGVHEDILTHLSHIKSLRVIARTSVMRYQETDMSVKEIAEELGVRYILEGSVRKAGDLIKVTVQLIDSSSEGHLWVDDYERRLNAENVFKIQEDISLAVVDSMRAEISPEEKEQLAKLPTENLAALEAYYKSQESLLGGARGYERSLEHLERAILLDSEFAAAHANLAQVQLQLINRLGLSPEQQYAKAEYHITKALEIDHTLVVGYRALAELRRRQFRDEEAIAALKDAIKWNPNDAAAHAAIGGMNSSFIGDASESAKSYRKAYELDPQNRESQRWLRFFLRYSGRSEEAHELLMKEVSENPDFADGYMWLALSYENYFGRYDESIIAFRRKLALDPRATAVLHWLEGNYIDLGDAEEAVVWNNRSIESKTPDNHMGIAYRKWVICKFLGDEDGARRIVLDSLQHNPIYPYFIGDLTDMDLESGNHEGARSRLEEALPDLFLPSVEVMRYNVREALSVARVLKFTGQSEQANELVRKVIRRLELGGLKHVHEIRKAVAYSIIGDESNVLSAIGDCFDKGGSPYRLEMESRLKPYFSHPEYVAMAEKRKAELAIQLERIRRMDAAGQLAPIPEHLRD